MTLGESTGQGPCLSSRCSCQVLFFNRFFSGLYGCKVAPQSFCLPACSDDIDHNGKPIDWGQWAITSNDPEFNGSGNPDTGDDYGPAPGNANEWHVALHSAESIRLYEVLPAATQRIC